MDKRQLHHLWTKLRWIKPWYFLILAILSAVICVFALRANNQEMIRLRDQVYAADKANSDVQTSLQALQAYVTTHMNTNVSIENGVYPPIQLKYTYERLMKAQADAASAANTKVYSEAQAICEQQNPTDVSGINRIPCIEQYVKAHTPPPQGAVQDAVYKFAFASPRWSPDLAGWSLVVAILSTVLFIVTLLGRLFLKRASK